MNNVILEKIIGLSFLFLSFPAWFLALAGVISGYYGQQGTKDIILDIFFRILFIGTPFGLLISGIGLLRYKKWGRFCAIFVSVILGIATFWYAITGLGYEGNVVFCIVCFGLGIFFLSALFYLFKNPTPTRP